MNIAVTVSIASLLFLGACAAGADAGDGSAAPAASGEVEGASHGQTQLAVGQTLHIALPSNATTGYQWQVSDMDADVLTPATPFGDEITDAHAPGMVGVGGATHWRFTASHPGSVTLTFAYRRAWERNTPPAETATYRIVVR